MKSDSQIQVHKSKKKKNEVKNPESQVEHQEINE